MKSYFNQHSSAASDYKETENEIGLPAPYNGRVGIAAMAKKLSSRVNNLCNED